MPARVQRKENDERKNAYYITVIASLQNQDAHTGGLII